MTISKIFEFPFPGKFLLFPADDWKFLRNAEVWVAGERIGHITFAWDIPGYLLHHQLGKVLPLRKEKDCPDFFKVDLSEVDIDIYSEEPLWSS